jgi:pyridoxamine 5'-phosphate oxidase
MTEPVHPGDPFAIFAAAFARAVATEPFEPNAMTLATVDAAGAPSARVVLLKGVDARGFVFYTNYESRKGRELEARPVAALMLHWKQAQEQVRIEGGVERVSVEESDAYFRTRPRQSQIGAWASLQSETLATRADLEARFAELTARFDGADVPRPPSWGGYRVVPLCVEFWYGRENRLHERYVYERGDTTQPFRHRLLFP